MAEQKDHIEKIKDALRIISLLIIGLGVGWLAELLVSPVAPIFIAALLGVAVAYNLFGGIMPEGEDSILKKLFSL